MTGIEACVELRPGESVILTGLHDGTVKIVKTTDGDTVERVRAVLATYVDGPDLVETAKWALSVATNAGASLPITAFENP